MHNPMHSRQARAKHFQHRTLDAITSNSRVVGSTTYFQPFGLTARIAAPFRIGDTSTGHREFLPLVLLS